MKRRKFLSDAVVGGLAAPLAPALSRSGRPTGRPVQVAADPNLELTRIGRWTLEELRDYFRKELFEKRMPSWARYGVDRDFGGFFSGWKKDGTGPTDKWIARQGRILWLFSRFAVKSSNGLPFLEAAHRAKAALTENGRDSLGRWHSRLSRDWKVLEAGPSADSAMAMALGLGEYARAADDYDAMRIAQETARSVTEMVLAPHFQPSSGSLVLEPGTRAMSVWNPLLGCLTPLAASVRIEPLAATARMCLRYILQFHWQRGQGCLLEYLRQDLNPFPPDALGAGLGRVSGRRGVEAAWLIMAEALRSGNRRAFLDATELGLGALESCWEEIPEAGLADFEDFDLRKKALDAAARSGGALADALVFAITAVEHTHSPEAVRWFDRVFGQVWSRPGVWNPADDEHEPRAILMCLEALERMIGRQGHVSPFLITS
jgi:N-acylglucosamine 2-epimerase